MRLLTAVATSPSSTSGAQFEGEPRLVGVGVLPRVLVADAEAVHGPAAAPELHAGRVGSGVEVAQNHRMHRVPVLGGSRRGEVFLVLTG